VSLTAFINNTDISNTYTENIPLSITLKSFNLFASNNIIVNLYYTITGNSTNEVVGKSYIFSNSVSFIITEANSQGNAQDSFLFLVTNTDVMII
jgi:hypothetical protein